MSDCLQNVCKPGSDGRRLVALKFVAATILLYTPDPSGSSEPPSNHSYEGSVFDCYTLYMHNILLKIIKRNFLGIFIKWDFDIKMFISAHLFVEKFDGFNMAWLRGGHPVLNVGDSSTEASKSLGLLLDQLRYSKGKSLNNSAMIVLINRFVFLHTSVHT